ncbi:MAG: alanine dehydrogenase [Saprospiraceae bacterium]
MSQASKPIHFSDFFAEGQYETQAETLLYEVKPKSLTIGIPRETIICEHRVALVPHSLRTLTGYGHKIIVQSDAGKDSFFSDHDFSEAGAIISASKEEVFKAQLIIKVAPPTKEEIEWMNPDSILLCPLQIPVLQDDYLELLKRKKITALAMEYLRSEDGTFPIVRTMSEIAGTSAILTAAEYLTNHKGGRGVLLGGISGVPPAKIVILGAGVVAENAIRVAQGLGASVRVFDNNVTKLMRLQNVLGRHIHTSTFNPVHLAYQLLSADVVVGAMHSTAGRSPILVTEEMVSKMKEGSVIVDVSIDQGGCVETSKLTTLDNPSFIKHGVIHYCVPNIASKVSRTASQSISNIITPLLVKLGSLPNIEYLLSSHAGIRNGCYAYKGCITNEYLARRFEQKYTPIDLLLTSNL